MLFAHFSFKLRHVCIKIAKFRIIFLLKVIGIFFLDRIAPWQQVFTRLYKFINHARELMGKEKHSINFFDGIPILNLAEPALISIRFRKKRSVPVSVGKFFQILIHTLCSKGCNISLGTSFPSGSCDGC